MYSSCEKIGHQGGDEERLAGLVEIEARRQSG